MVSIEKGGRRDTLGINNILVISMMRFHSMLMKQKEHRGRAETVYRQGCPSCRRQHFEVNVFVSVLLVSEPKVQRLVIHVH